MLFIHPYKTNFLLFSFFNIMMDSLNIDNRPKTLAFKTLKRLLYKYYPTFVKGDKKQSKGLDIKQFLVLLYDCIPNTKHVWSIAGLLKIVNILKSGTGKNPTTALYNDRTKLEYFFDEKRL